MNFIERVPSEQASSILTNDSDHISPGLSGKADTPVYLLTMYKGIGDAVAFGLSVIDQIIQNDPSATGKIDVLCNRIQAEIFEHDPRVNRLIQASEKLFNRPELTNWSQGVMPDAGISELVHFLRGRRYTAVFPGMIMPGFYFRLRLPVMTPNWLELGKNLLAVRAQHDVPMHKIARRMVNRYSGNRSPIDAMSDEIPLYLSSEQVRNAAEVVRDIKKRSSVSPDRGKLLVVATDTTSVVTRPPVDLLAASLSQALRQCPELVVCILQGYTDPGAALKLLDALKPAFDGRVFLMPAEPKPKLLDVAAFIDQADVFVTGDTGLMHLAATFKKVSASNSTLYYPHNGVHIIALFGGTNPGLYGYRERTTILGRGRKEQLAFKPGIAKETYDPRGQNLFDHITPEQLTGAILS
ncbi:MAG TPA: glycosyltransferase family 9 protein [Ktedonobacteraceae bacterium]